MLDERAERRVVTLIGVGREQRDYEIRNAIEPLDCLLFGAGPGPLPHSADVLPHLGLADDGAAIAAVFDDGPQRSDPRLTQMGMVRVFERRAFLEEGCGDPFD